MVVKMLEGVEGEGEVVRTHSRACICAWCVTGQRMQLPDRGMLSGLCG